MVAILGDEHGSRDIEALRFLDKAPGIPFHHGEISLANTQKHGGKLLGDVLHRTGSFHDSSVARKYISPMPCHERVAESLRVLSRFQIDWRTESDDASDVGRGQLVLCQVLEICGQQQGQMRPGTVSHQEYLLGIAASFRDVLFHPGEASSDIL